MSSIKSEGLTDADQVEKSGAFLSAISKAGNFDMTLMFLDDAELDIIKSVKKNLDNHKCASSGEF